MRRQTAERSVRGMRVEGEFGGEVFVLGMERGGEGERGKEEFVVLVLMSKSFLLLLLLLLGLW